MKELGFRDYNVRVWSGDVFINSYNVLGCMSGQSGHGIQTNTLDEKINEDVLKICQNIADEFIKLNNMVNEIENSNEKRMENE